MNAEASLPRPPFSHARRQGVLVLGLEAGRARVVHRADAAAVALAELRRYLDRPLALERVDDDAFEALLQEVYESASGQTMQLMEEFGGGLDLSRVAEELNAPEELLESDDDAPIIRLINALLTEAIKNGASDIHIEPFERHLAVRFRVDGVLREMLRPEGRLAPLIASRVKVMAKLDIAEKRLPQDGRISLTLGGRAVDVRVSTLPTSHGERVVMRLLDKQAGRLDLEQLGMPSADLARLEAMIRRPHGIVLITGPTGSGKTTTLYAALTRLNDRKRNIMTVEDPVEYHLEGIGQTQVNSRVEMSFARGLRAILRQDPDVVMVGEIRDLETAQIAVQASLTGHTVFSTLHTNSAVGSITRLRDMGVEPFLLASSLVGVVAQRLVRRLCPDCKHPYEADEAQRALVGAAPGEPCTLYVPVGCERCHGTGYRGRSGLYEVVEVDETLRTLIHDGAGEQAMERHARAAAPSLRDEGMARVRAGETALEEVLRVASGE